MGQPGVDVDRAALLPQAKVWDDASASIGQIASTADGATWTGTTGPFTDAIDAYDAARQDVSIWCHQGQQEMQKIADALVKAYQTYDAAENSNIRHIRHIH